MNTEKLIKRIKELEENLNMLETPCTIQDSDTCLLYTSEFVGFTFQYLYEQNLDNVGIIEYRNKPTYYKEDLMLLKIPRYNTGNGAKYRSDCIMEKNIYNALIVTPRSAYSINSI